MASVKLFKKHWGGGDSKEKLSKGKALQPFVFNYGDK